MGGRTQPEQQAPPVQRLRVRYAKRGRARFTSHRDFSRAFERVLRRAGVPMAYSSGFSPHPRISYANASPTRAASEAEYLEIGLAEMCDAAAVQLALDAALPPGLDIVEMVPAPPGALADALTGSRWVVDVDGVEAGVLHAAVVLLGQRADLGRADHQERRPHVRCAGGAGQPGGLEGRVRRAAVAADDSGPHVPAVRPDDVLVALVALDPGAAPSIPPVLTRLAQGVLDPVTGLVREP